MSYIQYFEISGNTVSMLDSGLTLQVVNLQTTNMIVSGNTVNTNDFITTGGTQNLSGVKNFIGGLTVTGLTINGDLYNKANFLSANTSFYTQAQANANFLSANTSFYTQSQANANFLSANTTLYVHTGTTQTISGVKNFTGGLAVTGLTINGDVYNKANFLSANTSFYTQAQANANFLSANTSFYTQTQANANFLSANTSLYVHTGTTQTISGVKNFTGGLAVTGLTINGDVYNKANFLSANTSFYTQTQANANFLSANTSFYTQSQANANFLSANTSFYTQSQANANFLSANTTLYVHTGTTQTISGLKTFTNSIYLVGNIFASGFTLLKGITSNPTAISGNELFGLNAGNTGMTGSFNTAIGRDVLYKNTTGNNNVAIAYNAGYNNTTGGNNVIIGYQAGYSNTTGSSNVFIGYQAGYNETRSNKLYIANHDYTSDTQPLIYGEFNNKMVRINDNLETTGNLTISGNTVLRNGLDVTGNTIIRGNLNVITSFSGSTPNQDGQYLVYDKNISGFTNKFNGYNIIYVNYAMSPYTVTGISIHLIVDTSAGNVIVNLANYNVNLLGGSTVVSKITGDPNNIQINCPSGYTFLDNETSQYINKFNEHLQFTMVGPYMGVLYKETSDNRTDRNIITVSPNPYTKKDFNTIKEAIDFFNNRNDGDCVIQLDAAEHIIDSTINVNSTYNLIIQGSSYDQSSIVSTIQLTGQPMFISNTNINFEKLSLYGYAYGMGYSGYGFRNTEDGIRINGDNLYCQFQDVGIYGFYNNILLSGNSEIWVFNSSIESAANAGIYDYNGNVTVSETGFVNNKNSVYLYSGSSNKVSIENSIFETANTAQTSINYIGTQFGYNIFYIQGNAFYGTGTTLTGFNFAIARDSDIRIRTNPGIQDYTALAYVVFTNNSTSLATTTTATKAPGTNNASTFGIKFNTSTNNRATYLSSVSSPIKIMVTGNIVDASNNRTLIVSINKNGSSANVIQEVEVRCASATAPYPFSLNAIVPNTKLNDYYEIFVRDSATGGGNITLRDLQFILEQ